MPDAIGDAVGDHLHLGHAHAAGGNSRGAQTHARSHERAAGLARDSVLIGGDVHAVQTCFQLLAGALLVTQVDQHEVVVGAAGHQLDTACLQLCCQSLCILHDLAGIFLELRLQCFTKADSFCGDHMLQRAALGAGEHGRIDALCKNGIVGQDQTAAGATQGLVGGGGNNISIRHRTLVIAACHQTGNVGHIHHQICTIAVGDLSDLLKIDGTGICRRTGHDQLGAHLLNLLFQLSIVDHAIGIDTVRDKVIVLAGHVYRRTVGQMAALRQVHAHDSIAQIQQSKINCQIGLCTGVGLNIGIFCAEQLAGTLDGNVLHLVHIDTAAIVALAGQALGVLVGQDTAHCGHDGGRDDVLTGDQFNVLALTVQLAIHGCGQLRINGIDQTDGVHHFIVHNILPLSISGESPGSLDLFKPPCSAHEPNCFLLS